MNNDSWSKAEAAARERLNPKNAAPSDETVGDRLVRVLNERRSLAEPPPVTSSFASASARAAWRIATAPFDAEIADAAGAFASEYGIDADEMAEQVAAALALPADQLVALSDPAPYEEADDAEPYASDDEAEEDDGGDGSDEDDSGDDAGEAL